MIMATQRTPFDIPALDDMLYGGLIPGSANLIEGTAGTGKTTLAMQFIYNGIVTYDEPGLIITFEEFPQQYYHDAEQFGWDLKELERQKKLKIIFSDPHTTLQEFEELDGMFASYIEDMGVKRVAVDSITHLEYLSTDTTHQRETERQFINSLKREGVTSLLLRENDTVMGQLTDTHSKVPFIVDSYILLRYVEIRSAIRKALAILKMRGSNHDKDIRAFEITPNGIEVADTFSGIEGILSGNTRATPQDAFVDVFGKKKKGKGS